mmetsp:Transcript_19501/g.51990  ORF Transcript_19501/g.51990 Transcript_19501/m.51990 type:complete len:215 (-) Transcript_19501:3499-4143(-)
MLGLLVVCLEIQSLRQSHQILLQCGRRVSKTISCRTLTVQGLAETLGRLPKAFRELPLQQLNCSWDHHANFSMLCVTGTESNGHVIPQFPLRFFESAGMSSASNLVLLVVLLAQHGKFTSQLRFRIVCASSVLVVRFFVLGFMVAVNSGNFFLEPGIQLLARSCGVTQGSIMFFVVRFASVRQLLDKLRLQLLDHASCLGVVVILLRVCLECQS